MGATAEALRPALDLVPPRNDDAEGAELLGQLDRASAADALHGAGG